MVPLRPLSVGELLDAAIRTYRERFKALVSAVAVPVIPVVILQTLVAWSVAPEGTDPLSAPEASATIDAGQLWLQLAGSLANVVAVLIGTALATAACFRVLSAAYVGGEVGWRESLAFARTRLVSVIGLTLLTGFGTVLGFLLCIVPGVLAFTWWSVATPALLMEGLGTFDAMRRSKHLAKQRFWPVLGAVLLSSLLAGIFQGMVSAPLIGLMFTDVSGVLLYVVQGVVNLIALVLVTPFTAAFTLALYVDLRVRFEGFDLYLWANRSGTVATEQGTYAAAARPTFGPGYGPGGGFAPPPPPAPPSGFGPPVSKLPPPPVPPPDARDT